MSSELVKAVLGVVCTFSNFGFVKRLTMSSEKLIVLKDNEETILSSLEEADLGLLSDELYRHGITTLRLKEDYSSLDHHRLDVKLRSHFLLHHVYDKLRGDEGAFHLFVEVLYLLGGSLKALGEWLEFCGENLEGVEENQTEPSGATVGSKRLRKTRETLCEDDINILIQLLHGVTHCWEEIAIVLGLSPSEKEDCRRINNNCISLYNVLMRWVAKGNTVGKPVSIGYLQEKLITVTVNQGRIARDLEEKFMKAKTENSQNKCKRRFIDSSLRIIQPKNTIVTYGKSTILQVISKSQSVTVHYQWMKDGVNLAESENFSGVNSPLLFVRLMETKLEGSYSCQVWDDKNTLCSDNASLIMYHPSITEKFWGVYRKQDEIPTDSWPPVAATRFINLALIMKSKTISNKFDYAVQGDIDDIISAKETIDYKEVFGKYQGGVVILIEGRPGSGKTTLMHKVAHDWSLKRGILEGANIVVLIPLRLLDCITGDIDLYQILKLHFDDDAIITDALNYFEKYNGMGMCFLIDGLDEYSLRDKSNTIIYKLMNRKILDASMVIIASRPSGTSKLRNMAFVSQRVEVLGFSSEHVLEYIKHYPFVNDEAALSLPLYLHSHNNVMHICYLPVHMAMICFLYEQMGDDIPSTETKIYEYFTLFSITRKLKKESEEDVPFSTLKDLSGATKVLLDNICKLAFDMTVNVKQVVYQKDIKLPGGKMNDDDSFGLVTIDSSAKLFNVENFYTYLHLTFQEYLTAVYIAQLDKDTQLNIIQSYKNRADFFMVWRFFCGSVDFEIVAEHFEQILFSDGMDMLNKVQCAFESQRSDLCKAILRANSISFSENVFTPSDFYAISHVVLLSDTSLSKLVFHECTLNEEGISIMENILQAQYVRGIKYLGYHKKNCTVSQFQALNALLRVLPSLEALDLKNTELKINGVKKMTKNLNLKCLKYINVHMPFKHDSIAKYLKSLCTHTVEQVEFDYSDNRSESVYHYYYEVLYRDFGKAVHLDPNYTWRSYNFPGNLTLKYHSNCREVVLINCGISDEDVQNFAQSIVTYKNLSTIKLDFNQITEQGAFVLASCMNECSSVQFLSAHCNQINDSGALSLVNAFYSLNDPKHLDLQCNPVSNDGIKAIKEVMQNMNLSMKLAGMLHINSADNVDVQLNFSWILVKASLNSFSNCSPASQSSALRCCTYWPQIHIGYESNFGLELNNWNINILCEVFKHFTNILSVKLLTPPSLYYANWRMTIFDNFRHWINLQHLEVTIFFEIGSITFRDFISFADALSHCANLQTLILHQCLIGADDAKTLARSVLLCRNLQRLECTYADVGLDGAMALVRGLLLHNNRLQLNFLNLNDLSSKFLAASKNLSQSNKLHLSFCFCNFNSDALFLAKELSPCFTSLNCNMFYRHYRWLTPTDIALVDEICECTSLQRLNLSGVFCSSVSKMAAATNSQVDILQPLYPFYIHGSTLEDILSHCNELLQLNLSQSDMSSLSEGTLNALPQSLQELNLSNACLNSGGAMAFATALSECKNLQKLDLSDNHILPDGARALAKVLSHCYNLQQLNLSNNSVSSEGSIALAGGLSQCTNLQGLILSHNHITSDAAVVLARELSICKNLQLCDLSFNIIDSESESVIKNILSCVEFNNSSGMC